MILKNKNVIKIVHVLVYLRGIRNVVPLLTSLMMDN
jgi:hypothetical protein